MLDKKGFDNWAEKYDESIKIRKGYPFAGYYEVLSYVKNLIDIKSNVTKILDIGIGTGELSKVLYDNGALIYGYDFSEKMIEIAQKKMPGGKFFLSNLNGGIPDEFRNTKFDFIISSYAFHHLDLEKKINLICDLKNILKKNGIIIIADIAFQSSQELEKCKGKYKAIWDEDEVYFIADEIIRKLAERNLSVKYSQISECAGILQIILKK